MRAIHINGKHNIPLAWISYLALLYLKLRFYTPVLFYLVLLDYLRWYLAYDVLQESESLELLTLQLQLN